MRDFESLSGLVRFVRFFGYMFFDKVKGKGGVKVMSMIKVENLTFSYPESYDNIFEDVNFQIDTDWISIPGIRFHKRRSN